MLKGAIVNSPSSPGLRVLVLGGTGFLSGAIVQAALARGHHVTVLTRGQRPVPAGVAAIAVDRNDRTAFARRIAEASATWDIVIDAIPYSAADAQQDLDVFAGRAGRLVFLSTDFVYDPNCRTLPQTEHAETYATAGYSGEKRAAERVLETQRDGLPWTIVRPTHLYGPGAPLGCLPAHSRDPRLIEHLQAGRPLRLAGAGAYLQQPVFVPDVANTCLDLASAPQAAGRILNVAGPEVLTAAAYYRILGELLGCEVTIESISTAAILEQDPGKAPLCCDRIYDLSALRATGVPLPATPFKVGLQPVLAALAPGIKSAD